MSLPKLDPKDADALMKEMGLTTSKYSTIDDFIKCYALAKGDIETTARFYQNSNVRKVEVEIVSLCGRFGASKDRLKALVKNMRNQLKEKDERLKEKDERLKDINDRLKDRDDRLNEKDDRLKEKDERLKEKDERLKEKDDRWKEKDDQCKEKDELIQLYLMNLLRKNGHSNGKANKEASTNENADHVPNDSPTDWPAEASEAAANKATDEETATNDATKSAAIETDDATDSAPAVKMAEDEDDTPTEDFAPKVPAADIPTNEEVVVINGVTAKAAMTDEKYAATNKPINDEAAIEADVKAGAVDNPANARTGMNLHQKHVQQRQLKSDSAADNTTKANMVDVTEDVANNITVKVGEAIIATQNIIVDISDAPLDFDKPLLSKRSKDTCIHRQRSPRKSVSPRKLRKETRDCRSRSPLKHDDRKEARNHRSESPHELEYHKETRNHSSRSSRKHDHRDETRDHRCAPRYYHDRRESRRYYEYY